MGKGTVLGYLDFVLFKEFRFLLLFFQTNINVL